MLRRELALVPKMLPLHQGTDIQPLEGLKKGEIKKTEGYPRWGIKTANFVAWVCATGVLFRHGIVTAFANVGKGGDPNLLHLATGYT